MKKRRGRVITVQRDNIDNTSNNRSDMTRKQEWEGKYFSEHLSDKQKKSHSRKCEHG